MFTFKWSYLIDRVSADVDVDPHFILEDLAVVMDPLGLISTEVKNNIKLVRLLDDVHELLALVDSVDITVCGILVSSTSRLVISVAFDCGHMRS